MIKPRPYGHDIETVRDDGALRIIPVHRGRESHACRAILAYRRANLLTDSEAAFAVRIESNHRNAVCQRPFYIRGPEKDFRAGGGTGLGE